MPSIYVSSGIEEGSCYGFQPGDQVFIVGRAPNCHIVLTDPLISRQHCRIERVDLIYKVIDLGSHNGVYVNEEKMEKDSERQIKFGDSIRLGETELVLQEAAPDDEGELAGRRLGAYQLVKRIGSGGMGEVYRAVQIALGRPVAIKILSPELTEDSSFIQRFMTEARAAGKLNHPNVAQVHEVGEADGIYYYSMEYLAGGSVQDQIRGGRKLPVDKAAKIILGCAKALEYAEKQGVIHCDIKPDNLMLTEDGEVRLTDLGIARTVASRTDKVKQEGGVLGSPHYMAPEQARGEPIDRRVDIYALGATFYRLVSGRTPFTGKNAREIMEKQVYEEPPGLRTLDPSIPLEVAQIIVKMMKKRPDKRYQSAREVVVDLTKFIDSLTVPPGQRATGVMHSVRRRAKRSGAGVGALLIAAVILAGGGYFVYAKVFRKDKNLPPDPPTLMRMADEAAARGDYKAARELYHSVVESADKASELFSSAVEREADMWTKLNTERSDLPGEKEWRDLEKRAEGTKDLRATAAEYEKFAASFPNSARAKEAKLAAQKLRGRHDAAAEAEVKALEAGQAKLIAAGRYAELAKQWESLLKRVAETPAATRAAELSKEAAALPEKELAAAVKAADAELAAGRFDAVLPLFDRVSKCDVPSAVAKASGLVEQYKTKIAAAREELRRAEDLRRRGAACKLIADDATKLALGYDYIRARSRFAEASLAYTREGLHAEAESVRRQNDDFQKEYTLFSKLIDYGDSGKLTMARVRLGDGREAEVLSVDADKITYTRGLNKQATVAWAELPAASVFSMLRRPKLSTDERLVLVSFAIRRALYAEAKVELERMLASDPDRKNDIAPLLEAAEKGLKEPAPAPPPPPPAAGGEKQPEEKK